MFINKIIIAFIPTIIVIIFGIITSKNKKNILNLILLGFLAIIIAMIFNNIGNPLLGFIYVIINNFVPNMFENFLLLNVVYNLFIGIKEEIAKRIAINTSKPKTPYQILYNCIFIASMFMSLENSSYMYNSSSYFLGIYRAFLPVHIGCQFITALIMINIDEIKKQDESKSTKVLTTFSILIPILLHAIYNFLVEFDNLTISVKGLAIHPLSVIIGIFIYIMILSSMFVISKKSPNDEIEIEQSKKSRFILKILAIIVLFYLWSVLYFVDDYTLPTNETLNSSYITSHTL